MKNLNLNEQEKQRGWHGFCSINHANQTEVQADTLSASGRSAVSVTLEECPAKNALKTRLSRANHALLPLSRCVNTLIRIGDYVVGGRARRGAGMEVVAMMRQKCMMWKYAAMVVLMLTLGVGEMWAWYVTAYATDWGSWDTRNIGTGEYTWYNVPAGKTFYFRFSDKEKDNWSSGDLIQNKGTWVDHKSLKESDFSLTKKGEMSFTLPENSHVTIKDDGSSSSSWKVKVYVRPAYFFKYNWAGTGGGWNWSGYLDSNGDGTYSTEGNYNNTCTSFNYDTQNRGAGTGAGSSTNIILSGTPSHEVKCFFIYNPDEDNRSLTIEEKNSTSGTNYMFFDNTNADWDDASIQVVLGHLSYSITYEMSKLGGSDKDYTNLYYCSRSGNDWTGEGCFAYFGMIGGSSKFGDGNWNSRTMYDATHYSQPLFAHQNLSDGYNYLISKADNMNGHPIAVEEKSNSYAALNFAQTVQYALSTDGGDTFTNMSSGNTPANITGSSYAFNGRTSVASTSLVNELTANTSTRYSTTISAAYTGKTTLTQSALRTGYTFVGWYEGDTQKSTENSYTYRPTSTNTVTARYKANRYTIVFNGNGNTGGTSMANQSFTYEVTQNLAANTYERTHYNFMGWATSAERAAAGTVDYGNGIDGSRMAQATSDNCTINLYAVWEEKTHTVSFANDGHGSTTPNATQQVGEITGLAINVTPNTGYQFNTWTSSNGGIFTEGATAASTTFKPTENTTLTASFAAKTYTGGILDDNGGNSDGTYSVTYNDTKIMIGSMPEKAGNEVTKYTLYDNGNDQVADANGNLVSGLTGYITDGRWTYDGAPTLYAQWGPKTYTISLDKNLPSGTTGIDGTGTFTAKYGTNTYSTISTLPIAEGYIFAGYYTNDATPVQVITANSSICSGTAYIDGSGNWINTSEELTLYAHWTDNGTYVYKGGTSGNETTWSTAANWTKGTAPSANDGTEDIILLAPVIIPASATTTVHSVRIGTAGSYTPTGSNDAIDAAGKLTIPATSMLKVTSDVKNYDFSTSTASNTTPATLHIQSASTGNGALVWGNAGSTPGGAQVDFYTISSAGGSGTGANTDVNQYIGTPFSDESNYYNYYNAWVFKVNAAGTAWERLPMGSHMDPFVGYDVIYDGPAGHVFEMNGTLVTNADKTCTLTHNSNNDENLLANSWTAPMWIKGFASEDFTNANAAIYIFNSTSEKASQEAGRTAEVGGGNYTAYTPGTSNDDYIPSMQSFSVLANGGGTGSVTLNYANLVKNSASHSHIGTMYAPRRVASDEVEPEAKMDFLRLRVDDENGWADELKIYIREDFVNAFENGFDARKMYGDERAPMLYGISTDGMMAINCIPTADNSVVGFHAGTASNEYTFRFTYDGEEDLYLKDTKLDIETKIADESCYQFYATPLDSDMRFVIIRKAPTIATGMDRVGADANVQKVMYGGALYIIRQGRIYNAEGTLVK